MACKLLLDIVQNIIVIKPVDSVYTCPGSVKHFITWSSSRLQGQQCRSLKNLGICHPVITYYIKLYEIMLGSFLVA